jgi:predicted DNA-binding ribbon-helix-helix protein
MPSCSRTIRGHHQARGSDWAHGLENSLGRSAEARDNPGQSEGKAMKLKGPWKSSRVKPSIRIAGNKTSISLEEGFWDALTEIVKERQTTLQDLVTSINAERRDANLSSAVRVFILDHFVANKRSTRNK